MSDGGIRGADRYRRAVVAIERLQGGLYRLSGAEREKAEAGLVAARAELAEAKMIMRSATTIERLALAAERDPERCLDPYVDELESVGRWKRAARALAAEVERLEKEPAETRLRRRSRIEQLVSRHNAGG